MKLLILENETIRPGSMVNIAQKFVKQNHTIDSVEIIEHAHMQPVELLVSSIKNCDIVLFETTWLRINQLYPFVRLLSQNKNQLIIYSTGSTDRLPGVLDEIWQPQELMTIDHHKLIALDPGFDFDKGALREIDLTKYRKSIEEKERERVEYNDGLKTTGRKIKIIEIKASGNHFSNLKQDMVVDELECPNYDPNPNRGTWVMGHGEPVKLLNDDMYAEWTYDNNGCIEIVGEIFTAANCRTKYPELQRLVTSYLNGHLSSKIMAGEDSIHDFVSRVIDQLELPRRFYRSFFTSKIEKYLKNHTYFCEHSRSSFDWIFTKKTSDIFKFDQNIVK